MWKSGAITATAQVQPDGLEEWTPALDLMGRVEKMEEQKEDPPKADRAIYFLLAFFLGTIGIHNFYAGQTGAGVFRLISAMLLGMISLAGGEVATGAFLLLGLLALSAFIEGCCGPGNPEEKKTFGEDEISLPIQQAARERSREEKAEAEVQRIAEEARDRKNALIILGVVLLIALFWWMSTL
jgi:TM2 domain-containing membrane protein YozV